MFAPDAGTIANAPGRSEAAIVDTTYKAAGVDVDAGMALVEAIKPLARATARPGLMGGIGGFGGLFDLKAAGFRDPILVSGTDGVGTKLKVAIAARRHDTIGIDLVAMCVNDVLVHGAEPLFFLDYYATGRLDVEAGRAIIKGIAEGCRLAGCALLGGETAEMPGMYGEGDYDLAGFAVGAVERERLLQGGEARPGDVLIGIPSSGLHSNGFSLVRRIVAERGLAYGDAAPFDPGRTLGEAFLAPTRIYVRTVLPVMQAGLASGLVHVTGGGLLDNVPRVLPKGTVAAIDAAAWELPAVFRWLAGGNKTRVAPLEMARTFNCGIGMVAVVPAGSAAEVERRLADAGERSVRIGEVRAAAHADAEPVVDLAGAERWRA